MKTRETHKKFQEALNNTHHLLRINICIKFSYQQKRKNELRNISLVKGNKNLKKKVEQHESNIASIQLKRNEANKTTRAMDNDSITLKSKKSRRVFKKAN